MSKKRELTLEEEDGLNAALFANSKPVGALPAIPLTDEVVRYIAHYGGMCRDCADEDGVCPRSGLPCNDSEKAIRYVINACNYGVMNGFLRAADDERQMQKARDASHRLRRP